MIIERLFLTWTKPFIGCPDQTTASRYHVPGQDSRRSNHSRFELPYADLVTLWVYAIELELCLPHAKNTVN